jgi:trk system potassium uptake protein TrkA
MRILIVGSGPIVYFLAREFIARHHPVTVVTDGPVEAHNLSRRLKADVLQGDGSDPRVLEDAGARRADALLALTQHDHDNLAICQIAGNMFGIPRTIVIVNDPENEEIFRRLGVSVAISSTTILARILEERMGFEEIYDLFAVSEGNVMVSEVSLRGGEPAADRQLDSLELPKGALIGGIIRDGQVIVPRGGTRLKGGDRLIVIAEPQAHDEVLHLLTGGRF